MHSARPVVRTSSQELVISASNVKADTARRPLISLLALPGVGLKASTMVRCSFCIWYNLVAVSGVAHDFYHSSQDISYCLIADIAYEGYSHMQ